jgi:hypothetical protein
MTHQCERAKHSVHAFLFKLLFFALASCISSSLLPLLSLAGIAYGASTERAVPAHSTPGAAPTVHGSFRAISSFRGIGSDTTNMVGPGPAGTQRYYLTYLYYLNSFDLVAIDPNNVANPLVFHSPISTESGAYALTVGPDNNLYLGTEPDGDLLQFNTQAEQFTDLGTFPSDPVKGAAQSYIWQFTVSPYDHKIYGCTYPTADLVSYDPSAPNPELVNLGSIDATYQEAYARSCVADPDPNDPYIYIGAGDTKAEVVAYNIATHTSSVLLSDPVAGFGGVYDATDGNVYGTVGVGQYSKLIDGVAYSGPTSITVAPTNVFANGETINVNAETATVTLTRNSSVTTYPYHYTGEAMDVFRLAMGPGEQIYGSSALPAYLIKIHERSGKWSNLGYIGGGELYSLTSYQKTLYMAGYASIPYGIYQPATGFGLGTNPMANTGIEDDLRSEAMIVSPVDNKIYFGSIAGYGKLNGPLSLADPNNINAVAQYQPIANESVVSLAVGQQTIIGGTSIFGGGGIQPTATTAALFTWDPLTEQMTRSVDVPNTTQITDLITAPNGDIYGLGATSSGYELITVDPATLGIIATTPFPYAPIYNSVAIGPDGNIWGLAANGIFTITTAQPNAPHVTLVAQSPVTITGGFAITKQTIYFTANSTIYAYLMR